VNEYVIASIAAVDEQIGCAFVAHASLNHGCIQRRSFCSEC
jgi:hypothetical protein